MNATAYRRAACLLVRRAWYARKYGRRVTLTARQAERLAKLLKEASER